MNPDANKPSAKDTPVVPALNFIFEMSQLRLEDRSGWQRIGEKPESVAEHSLRAAQLGFILAHMENSANEWWRKVSRN